MDSKDSTKLAYIQKEIELRQNLVGGGFLIAPIQVDELRANIIGSYTFQDKSHMLLGLPPNIIYTLCNTCSSLTGGYLTMKFSISQLK